MRQRRLVTVLAIPGIGLALGCGTDDRGGGDREGGISLMAAGQALIKVDPRLFWPDPFGSISPLVQAADVAFTNFEMAVADPGDRCSLPADYLTILGGVPGRVQTSPFTDMDNLPADYAPLLGTPDLSGDPYPGNTSGPHAVEPAVMEFLSSLGFNLMSLANNHIWDLGPCGVEATRAAARAHGVTVAGAAGSLKDATAPAYLTVDGVTVALVAAMTTRDERELLLGEVNGVWTGHQTDWDRNLAAVEEASRHADVVIFSHHFQIHDRDFEGLEEGETTRHGHVRIDDVKEWQERFGRAVIDAGASIYLGHGHRGFDGVEIYNRRPIFWQLGMLAYQGQAPTIGGYEGENAWWGVLTTMDIEDGAVRSIELIPLELDEGGAYAGEISTVDFLNRRGFAEVATGSVAMDILDRFRALSEGYGTAVEIRGERALVTIPALD